MLPGVRETSGHVVAMRNPTQMLFLSFAYEKRLLHFGTRFDYVKKHKLFITVLITAH